MAKGFIHGLMEENMWEITNLIENRDLEDIFGVMVGYFKDNGDRAKEMEREN